MAEAQHLMEKQQQFVSLKFKGRVGVGGRMKLKHFVRLNSSGSAKPGHQQAWGDSAQWGAEGSCGLGRAPKPVPALAGIHR